MLASTPPSGLFQSAPDREVGRCDGGLIESAFTYLFQSAPDREVGRCFNHGAGWRTRSRFNPRPTVRSGDASVKTRRQLWANCFNPRPTVRSGDANVSAEQAVSIRVSIRARP